MPFKKGHTTNLGRKLSEETRQKMSRVHKKLMPKEWGGGFQQGNIPWNEQGSIKRNAYYAGLVDGEGHIGIYGNSPYETKRYHKVSVRIAIATSSCLEDGQKYWGGWIYKRQMKDRNVFHEWVLQSFYATKFLKDILPYLKEKKEQAEILIRFYGLQKRKSRQSIQKFTDEEWQHRLELIRKLKSLHLNKGTHVPT